MLLRQKNTHLKKKKKKIKEKKKQEKNWRVKQNLTVFYGGIIKSKNQSQEKNGYNTVFANAKTANPKLPDYKL